MIIYKATNKVNGKAYVGQTVRSLEERLDEHQRKSKTAFDKAIKKYGIDCFDVVVIDSASNIEELNAKEAFWIDFYKCLIPDGYNMCIGGGNTKGFHHSEESKAKMSASKSSLYCGSNNPFHGKHHTKESKGKMSDARKGMAHLSQEQIERLRRSHYTVRVVNIDTGEVFPSATVAALAYGIPATNITRVCKGKKKTCAGFHWKYVT